MELQSGFLFYDRIGIFPTLFIKAFNCLHIQTNYEDFITSCGDHSGNEAGILE